MKYASLCVLIFLLSGCDGLFKVSSVGSYYSSTAGSCSLQKVNDLPEQRFGSHLVELWTAPAAGWDSSSKVLWAYCGEKAELRATGEYSLTELQLTNILQQAAENYCGIIYSDPAAPYRLVGQAELFLLNVETQSSKFVCPVRVKG